MQTKLFGKHNTHFPLYWQSFNFQISYIITSKSSNNIKYSDSSNANAIHSVCHLGLECYLLNKGKEFDGANQV